MKYTMYNFWELLEDYRAAILEFAKVGGDPLVNTYEARTMFQAECKLAELVYDLISDLEYKNYTLSDHDDDDDEDEEDDE
jgi:hypothetical protein